MKKFLLACAAIAVVSPAMAGNVLLGTYAFTGTDTCLASRSGFDPVSGQSLDSDGGIAWNAVVSGIATFSSGGVGKITQQFGAIATEGGGAFSVYGNGTVQFTYAMVTDGQFTVSEVLGTNIGNFTAGTFGAIAYGLNATAPWQGFIAGGGGRNHQLVMSTQQPTGTPLPESWAFSKTWQAECSRSRVLIKIDPDDTN